MASYPLIGKKIVYINENHEYKYNEKNEHPFLNEQIRILL